MKQDEKIKQTYLRIPEEFHKELRHEAAEDDVSLNLCILTLLQEALGARRSSLPKSQRTDSKPQA